jgi:hypothetical protein
MSGTQNPPYETTPLTDTQKTDARRFMGYGFAGLNSSFSVYRFFEIDGLMEWRLSNCTDTEIAVIIALLATLNAQEQALFGSTANLTIDTVGPFKHNANEIRDRNALHNLTRRKLCGCFGLPAGPDLAGSGIQRQSHN